MLTTIICLSPQLACAEKEKYQPNWESLSQWQVPQWINDAVMGFYAHWGVYSVPGHRFNDGKEVVDSGLWYGKFMYIPNGLKRNNYGCYDFHRKNYGEPCETGYHELIPLFTAAKWDPDEWVSLFKYAGGDYAGVTAEHGDGFVLWDSDYDKFNSMDMGPKRDIVGELFEACRKQGLKTVATVHEPPAETYEEAFEHCPEDSHFHDPQYADLYQMSEFDVLNKKLLELTDKYQPDQLWFEDAYCGLENWKEYIAYYYNQGEKWGKEVFISQKHDLAPLSCSIFDIEGGIFGGGVWAWAGMEKPQKQRWQKDVPIGNYWAYAEGVGCRPVNMLIDGVIDRISKNGVTLFDVAPKADGTLPQEQIDGLKAMGDWMKHNKEALYAARCAPFHPGGVDTHAAGTIRFTEKGDYLYAIEMGNQWPPTKGFAAYGDSKKPQAPFTIPGVKAVEGSDIIMLGDNKPLKWQQKDNDIIIEELPKKLPCDYAWSFKIQVK